MIKRTKLDGSRQEIQEVNLEDAIKVVFNHLLTVPDGKIAIEVLKRFLGG